MAGCNYIQTPASIFVGHYLNEFYAKFESILLDSFSRVKILEREQFDSDRFLFPVEFESLYTNILVKHAIDMMKELVFKYRNVI